MLITLASSPPTFLAPLYRSPFFVSLELPLAIDLTAIVPEAPVLHAAYGGHNPTRTASDPVEKPIPRLPFKLQRLRYRFNVVKPLLDVTRSAIRLIQFLTIIGFQTGVRLYPLTIETEIFPGPFSMPTIPKKQPMAFFT